MVAANIRTEDVVLERSQLPVKVTGMQSMARKMWLPFLGMGFMIVIAAFVVGLIISNNAAEWLSFSKLARDTAERGSALATQKAFIESTKIWLPAVKFLGLGMMLGGVTFLLATILGALRTGGGKVKDVPNVHDDRHDDSDRRRSRCHPNVYAGLRLLEPLYSNPVGRSSRRQRIARQPWHHQRYQAMAGAIQVRWYVLPVHRFRSGTSDYRARASLAEQSPVGASFLSKENLL